MLQEKIIEKYNIASPRYTSYPTILDWNQPKLSIGDFKREFRDYFSKKKNKNTSVYIHLPFCESLCTFCGCHKHITKNHDVEAPYIVALLKEWDHYLTLAGGELIVNELHLGGGTPTFFSTKSLKKLINIITKNKDKQVNFSVEGHPNHTSEEQLQLFYDLGFRRISFGVQDYDKKVQTAINRVQSFSQVKKITESARKKGFTSISHDLIFGLPHQTLAAIEKSIELTIKIRPDNISLYSYAHVPWVKGTGQRGFSDKDIPTGKEKRMLYESAKEALLKAGYIEIGIDHFGLPTEPMTIAMKEKRLNRNFMGYTTSDTETMIGLGVSAISEYPFGYTQNIKSVKEYQSLLNNNELTLIKGHFNSPDDISIKKHIKALMCNFETQYEPQSWIAKNEIKLAPQLIKFKRDGILIWEKNKLMITEAGRPFVRNVCMTLDPYMNNKSIKERFSKSI